MTQPVRPARLGWVFALSRALRRPETVAFLPALTLAAFWFGGESWLILTALGTPMLYVMAGALREVQEQEGEDGPLFSGLCSRGQLVEALDKLLLPNGLEPRGSAALVLQLDDLERIVQRHGRSFRGPLMSRIAERVFASLRDRDLVCSLEDGRMAVVLAGARRLDLEIVIQLAARLQGAIAQPFSIGGQRVHTTASVGFCLLDLAPQRQGAAIMDAAEIAADEAARNGPGGLRSYSPEMTTRRAGRIEMRGALETALDEGQIRAHFQPQISTDTGDILGFEALARWYHPERGLVPPGEFLTQIDDSGLTERLAEVMLQNALSAMNRWDKAGMRVPSVAVNFSANELRDPRLVDKLKWELDRYGLEPPRLCVEVLENVVAQNDSDIIVSNIAALSRMGCGIDLDDFGTGHASITSIRRFAVKRLKIDRSFVAKLDEDPEQQKLVAAILSMAERLGLDTLAEGVETAGEHALLSQLGCQAVQGFGIARPMPMEETISWMERHRARLVATPRLRHKSL